MPRVLRLIAVALALACSAGDPTRPLPPTTASVRLRAATTGDDADPNGYLIRFDNRTRTYRLGTNSSITIDDLPPGVHTLTVGDVSANCTATPTTFTIDVAAGDAPVLEVQVSCVALGMVRVSVVTTGEEVDADGYAVIASGMGTDPADVVTAEAPSTGSVLLPRLAPGPRAIALRRIAANCDLSSDAHPRTVDVASGATVIVGFEITCRQPGLVVYAESLDATNSEIFVVRSNGTLARPLTNHPSRDEDPVWSPDGSLIAFTSDRDGRAAIYVMTETGENVTRLTEPTSASYRPAWSPDGRRIAFVSERDDNAEVYVMNADGSSQARLTTDGRADRDPAWSPDGTRIAFASHRDGDSDVYIMNADGSGVERVTANDTWDGQPAWSPDGTRLAYARTLCSAGTTGAECYPAVLIVETSSPRSAPIMVGLGDDPAWSPDGRQIAVTGYLCAYYYWYFYGCGVDGIRVLTPAAPNAMGFVETWEPVLTRGLHMNPSWRP